MASDRDEDSRGEIFLLDVIEFETQEEFDKHKDDLSVYDDGASHFLSSHEEYVKLSKKLTVKRHKRFK